MNLNSCYIHFYYFVREYDLVPLKELEPLVRALCSCTVLYSTYMTVGTDLSSLWIQVSPHHAQALISMFHAEIGKAWLIYVCVVCSGCGSERTWTSKYATVYSIPLST